MAFLQSRDRRNGEAEVAAVVHKGRRMGVAAEGNPLCVAAEGSGVRSHPGRSNRVA